MSANAQLLSVRLEDIRMDGGTQSRAGIDPAVVERYAESVDELPPVDLFHDGATYWLADGFHRVAALELRGHDLFAARVHQGTQRDAILYACGANAHHGLPRTTADARRAVERLLADEEWRARSDRWIATTCRVSPTWVGRLRAELGAHAEVREYERAGVPHRMDLTKRELGEGPLSTVDSRNVGEDTFQAPEPDNMVRTKVVHEHQGAPLTDELREAIVKLMRSGWTRAHVAERFRVAPMDVDAVMAAASVEDEEPEVPDVFHAEAPSSKPDPELVEDAVGDGAPSSPPAKRFAAPSKSDPDRRTDRDLLLSQWWTPADLAEYLVKWAGITLGDHVLEPAAGTGAIVAALLAAGASVEAHEIDGHWIPQLKGRCSNSRLEVWHDDYLASPPRSVSMVRRAGRTSGAPPTRPTRTASTGGSSPAC